MNRIYVLFVCVLFIFTNVIFAAGWRQQMDSCKYNLMRYNYHSSLDYARKALPAAEKEFGTESRNYVNVLDTLGYLFSLIGTQDSCIFYGEMSLEKCRKIFKSNDYELLNSLDNLASYYSENYNIESAGEIFKELIPKARKNLKTDQSLLAACLANYAQYLLKIQKNDEAEKTLLEVLNLRRQLNKEGDEQTLSALLDVFNYYNDQDSLNLSEKYLNEASVLNSKLLLNDCPVYYLLMKAYATYSKSIDSNDMALSQMGEVLDAERQFFGKPNKQLLLDMISYSMYLSYLDQYDSLKIIFNEIKKLSDTICSEFSYLRFRCLQVGNQLYFHDRSDSSKDYSKEAYRISKKIFPDKKLLNIETISSMAVLMVALDKTGDAISILEDALEKEENEYTQPSKIKFSLLILLGFTHLVKEKYSKAIKYFNQVIEMKKFLVKINDWNLRHIHLDLAICYIFDHKAKDADNELSKYISIYRQKTKPDDIILANALMTSSQWYIKIFEWKSAEKGIKEALNIYRIKSVKQPDPKVANATLVLGSMYIGNEYYILAEKMLLESLAMLKEIHKSDNKSIVLNLDMLGLLYELTMNLEFSRKYYQEASDMYERLRKNEK